jgi:hypothetical protein
MTSGNVDWIVLIAVQSTRSPPPPALLKVKGTNQGATNTGEKIQQKQRDPFHLAK